MSETTRCSECGSPLGGGACGGEAAPRSRPCRQLRLLVTVMVALLAGFIAPVART